MQAKPLNKPRILCVALSPAVQRTLHFSALRRGEVNRVRQLELSAAGKGVNVARVVKTLGGRPTLIGLAGGYSGRQLKALLKDENLMGTWIPFEGETRHAHTLLEGGEVTELVEENPTLAKSAYSEFITACSQQVKKSDAMILAGSPPPGAPTDVYKKIIRQAGKIPVLIDAQKSHFLEALQARPAMAKCNREELGKTLDTTLARQTSVLQAMAQLMKHGAQNVFITDGAKPALLMTRDGCWKITPASIAPVNPIGSGDAVNAGIMVARLSGASWRDACGYGMACGAANALTSKPGHLSKTAVGRLSKDTFVDVLKPAKLLPED